MIILTGANRGIGYEIGRILSKNHKIIAITRDDIELDYDCIQLAGHDVRDWERILDEVSEHGVPSTLINCAGVATFHCSENIKEDMGINAISCMELIKGFVDRHEKGRIIQISSMSADSTPNHPHYAASKAAINHYINCMIPYNPDFNFTIISPGFVDTDMVSMHQVPKIDPIDVAEAVEFVLSRRDGVDIRKIELCSTLQR